MVQQIRSFLKPLSVLTLVTSLCVMGLTNNEIWAACRRSLVTRVNFNASPICVTRLAWVDQALCCVECQNIDKTLKRQCTHKLPWRNSSKECTIDLLMRVWKQWTHNTRRGELGGNCVRNCVIIAMQVLWCCGHGAGLWSDRCLSTQNICWSPQHCYHDVWLPITESCYLDAAERNKNSFLRHSLKRRTAPTYLPK